MPRVPTGNQRGPAATTTPRAPAEDQRGPGEPSLATNLFRLIQLRHHLPNWSTPPQIHQDPSGRGLPPHHPPPLADNYFMDSMESIRMELESNLSHTVSAHLNKKINEVVAAIENGGPNQQWGSSMDEARRRLRERFGRKVDLRQASRVFAEIMQDTTNPPPPLRPATNGTATGPSSTTELAGPTTPTTTYQPAPESQTAPTVPTPQQTAHTAAQPPPTHAPAETEMETEVRLKRRRSLEYAPRPPPFVSNPFEILTIDQDEDDLEVEPSGTPYKRRNQQASPPPLPQRVAAVRTNPQDPASRPDKEVRDNEDPTTSTAQHEDPADPNVSTASGTPSDIIEQCPSPAPLPGPSRPSTEGARENLAPANRLGLGLLKVHASKKDRKIWSIETRRDTEVVLIADSNGRLFRNLPQKWEAHAFPGAYFSDMPPILSSPSLTNKTIILAVGVNNRSWVKASLVPDINKMAAALNKITGRGFVSSIALTHEMQAPEYDHVSALNTQLERKFGSRFLQLNSLVSARSTDPIHFDQESADSILQQYQSFLYHLSSTGTPDPTHRFSL